VLHAPLHLASTLAAAAIEADRRGLVRSAFWLWLALIAVAVTAVAVFWLLTSSLTRKARGPSRPRRRRRIKDAWSEAGRRVEPLPHEDVLPDAGDDPHPDAPAGDPR
jgi:hypothetical protein